MTDRETLEAEALKEICPCRYYDLADGIDSLTDEELREIIEHQVKCDICGE